MKYSVAPKLAIFSKTPRTRSINSQLNITEIFPRLDLLFLPNEIPALQRIIDRSANEIAKKKKFRFEGRGCPGYVSKKIVTIEFALKYAYHRHSAPREAERKALTPDQ